MVYLISINYKWLLSVDQAFCKSYTCDILDFERITLDEIKRAVKQLRDGASAGPDLYINKTFKNGSEIFIHSFVI